MQKEVQKLLYRYFVRQNRKKISYFDLARFSKCLMNRMRRIQKMFRETNFVALLGVAHIFIFKKGLQAKVENDQNGFFKVCHGKEAKG